MSAWGKIKDIKITSQNQLSVDINRGDIANGVFDFKKQVSYSASADHSGYLPLYKTGTNTVFPDAGGYQLKYYPEVTAPQEVAYVLCSPVDALETVVEDGVDVKYPDRFLAGTSPLPFDLLLQLYDIQPVEQISLSDTCFHSGCSGFMSCRDDRSVALLHDSVHAHSPLPSCLLQDKDGFCGLSHLSSSYAAHSTGRSGTFLYIPCCRRCRNSRFRFLQHNK